MFALLFFVQSLAVGQFVTLKGRTFKDENGADFYPIVCCYSFDVIYNTEEPALDDLYLSRSNSYGPGLHLPGLPNFYPNYEYECDNQIDCRVQIHNDFLKIREKGFNTIRTHGLAATKSDPEKTGGTGFSLCITQNIHPLWVPVSAMHILPDYETDPVALKLFSFIDIVLEEAASTGLKVILDAGWGDLTYAGSLGTGWSDYADYLVAFADHFKNNSALMAYVTIEEPLYSHQSCDYSKSHICEMTSAWYDAIKSSDPNHLITIGGSPALDYLEWDPGVMKIDFYSPHIYPKEYGYEKYDQDYAFSRVLNNMLLLDKICPMPWMIGETGHSSIDDFYISEGNKWVKHSYLQPPEVDGDLEQQRVYAERILQNTRNCNASGFTWWNYQENWWGTSEEPKEDGFGLFRHGDVTDSATEKPVVSSFTNYPTPPPPPEPVQIPSTYSQPWATVGSYFPINGRVEDVSNNRITDGIVFGWNKWKTEDKPPHPIVLYGLTDQNGMYEISIPFNDVRDKLVVLKATAVSACVIKHEAPFIEPVIFQLDYHYTGYDVSINNEIVQIGTYKNYIGGNSLLVSNVTVEGNTSSGGIADFSAREFINVDNEFSAELGSDVHIYTNVNTMNCIGIPYKTGHDYSKTEYEGPFKVSKDITLTFTKLLNDFTIIPNPTSENFKLVYNYKSEQASKKFSIQIINSMGGIVEKINNVTFFQDINVENFSPGIYLIQICDEINDIQASKKLVVK